MRHPNAVQQHFSCGDVHITVITGGIKAVQTIGDIQPDNQISQNKCSKGEVTFKFTETKIEIESTNHVANGGTFVTRCIAELLFKFGSLQADCHRRRSTFDLSVATQQNGEISNVDHAGAVIGRSTDPF